MMKELDISRPLHELVRVHAQALYRIKELEKQNTLLLKRLKKEPVPKVRKRVTQFIKEWAIQKRASELGLKNITTWKELYENDPCVSNETEFYKSYLEYYNNNFFNINK